MHHRKTAASAPAEPPTRNLAIVGSLQTTFADSAIEREYACSRFTAAYNLVIAYCIGISVLTWLPESASRLGLGGPSD